MTEPVFDVDSAADRLEELEGGDTESVVGIRLFRYLLHRSKRSLTIELVDGVDDLPAEAPPTRAYRVRTGLAADRSTLFIGNGAGRPLGRLPISPL